MEHEKSLAKEKDDKKRSHPLVVRQKAYTKLYDISAREPGHKGEVEALQAVIGTMDLLVDTVVWYATDDVEYDMGRAIAAMDCLGNALHNIRTAFALANNKPL